MKWFEKNRFWILLLLNASLGIFWNWLFGLVAFVFIWMNYMLTPNMKKMLILDAVLVAATQAGAWYEYYDWLRTTEVIDVGASIQQLFNILLFVLHVFWIDVIMCWSFIRKKRKTAAWITGMIAFPGIWLFGFLVIMVMSWLE